MLIGSLIVRSDLIPNVIGALMMLAGVGSLIDSLSIIVAPTVGTAIGDYALLPGLIGEGALTLWLLVAGVRNSQGRVHA